MTCGYAGAALQKGKPSIQWGSAGNSAGTASEFSWSHPCPWVGACNHSLRGVQLAQKKGYGANKRSRSEVVAAGKTPRPSVRQRKQTVVSHSNSANLTQNRCLLRQLQGWEQSESQRYLVLWRGCSSTALREEWAVYLHFGKAKRPSAVMSLWIVLDLAACSPFSAFSYHSLFFRGVNSPYEQKRRRQDQGRTGD